jgi:quercetin dioxygenase-like cupin family protein
VFGGLRIDNKVAPADSGAELYVIEHTDHENGGPPRHVHHDQDEWFYVLEGTYSLEVGDDRYVLNPGDSIFAPRRVPHVWAHTSAGEGRLIIAFQPAGGMESFLNTLARAGDAPTPDALRPLFAAHGMTMTGPPLPV